MLNKLFLWYNIAINNNDKGVIMENISLEDILPEDDYETIECEHLVGINDSVIGKPQKHQYNYVKIHYGDLWEISEKQYRERIKDP